MPPLQKQLIMDEPAASVYEAGTWAHAELAVATPANSVARATVLMP
jgi:hypothetical protein